MDTKDTVKNQDLQKKIKNLFPWQQYKWQILNTVLTKTEISEKLF